MFGTYILYSAKLNRYYSGSTQNIAIRLEQHLLGKGKYTSLATDWKLVFQQQSDTRAEALALEKKIKSRGAKRFLEDMKSFG